MIFLFFRISYLFHTRNTYNKFFCENIVPVCGVEAESRGSVEAEAESRGSVEAEADAGANARIEAEARAGAGAGAEAGAEADADAESRAGAEANVEAEAGIKISVEISTLIRCVCLVFWLRCLRCGWIRRRIKFRYVCKCGGYSVAVSGDSWSLILSTTC